MLQPKRVIIASLIISMITPPTAWSGDLFKVFRKTKQAIQKSPFEQLAEAIDEVEEEIDDNGSIVVKQPDVWGEARWSAHRQQYEKQLFAEDGKFKFTVNARIRESDNAFLLSAQALASAAATRSGSNGATTGTGFNPFGSGDQPQIRAINLPAIKPLDPQDPSKSVDGVAIEPVLFLDQLSRYQKHLNQLRRINEGDDTADAPGYALNLLRIPVSILPGDETGKGHGAEISISLEPELSDNLLPSTFRSLVINDLVDQLGLPIVKLVESRPWKDTVDLNDERTEILEDLKAVRSFVKGRRISIHEATILIKSIDQRFGANPSTTSKAVTEFRNIVKTNINQTLQKHISKTTTLETVIQLATSRLKLREKNGQLFVDFNAKKEALEVASANWKGTPEELIKFKTLVNASDLSDNNTIPSFNLKSKFGINAAQVKTAFENAAGLQTYSNSVNKTVDEIHANKDSFLAVVNTWFDSLTPRSSPIKIAAPAPRSRQADYAVAPTEIESTFGRAELISIARAWEQILIAKGGESTESENILVDCNAFLREELNAAYNLLNQKKMSNVDLWGHFCPQIFNAVQNSLSTRIGNKFESKSMERMRREFATLLGLSRGVAEDDRQLSNPRYAIASLAWAILVESSLLNARLNKDIQRVELERNCHITSTQLPFYGSNPYPDSRRAFKDYVRERWPVHVFAIDPVDQTQNIADSFSRRREQQLALAIAFAGGDIGVDSFNRYARQLDFEQQTISLNRTVVGFSHGQDTFGWRLYPRVQSPPTPSNTEVKLRQLMFGAPSRQQDMKQRQLEPGMRELLAIVIMPSFVPFARMHVRTSWFELTDPNERRFTTADSVRMGRQIQKLRLMKTRCMNGDCFDRPGDARGLLRAIDQLERRLPMQEMQVQVPYENSLGGFQLFANGSRHLGPELIGFYGQPGIDTAKDTQLFLVGKNFNVNVTKVIAGGQLITDQDLLSRDILRVKIPKGTKTNSKGEVDIHVATPYGVSSHLHVPTEATKGDAAPKFAVTSIAGCAKCDKAKCTLSVITIPEIKKLKISGAAPLAEAEITIDVLLDPGTGSDLTVKKGVKLQRKPADSKGEISLKDAELEARLKDMFADKDVNVICPSDNFALVIKAKVQSVGKAAVSTSNALRIQVKGCKAGCADTGNMGVVSSLVSVPTVHFRPGLPLKVQTNPFAEFQTDGFATLKRALAELPQAEVAFFAYAMEGDKRMQRVAAGPFRVRGGNVLITHSGPVELSAKSIFQTDFKPGRNLESLVNSKLANSAKSDGIVLDAYARIPGQKSAQRVGDPIYLKVKRTSEPAVRFGTLRNASRRTVVPQLVK